MLIGTSNTDPFLEAIQFFINYMANACPAFFRINYPPPRLLVEADIDRFLPLKTPNK